MSYIADALREAVRDRAAQRCEYCRLHEADSYYTHEVDHIYAEKHDGATVDSNLCLACADCNRHKGSNLCSLDPENGMVVALFHPRQQNWHDHFVLNHQSGLIEPLTPRRRVTAKVLRFNRIEIVLDRLQLIRLGKYNV